MTYEEAIKKAKDNPDQFEIITNYKMELVCPNPREYSRRRMSYQDMKSEYEIAHMGEFSKEDLMKLSIIMRNQKQETFFNPLFLIPIIQIVLLGLLMFSRYYY